MKIAELDALKAKAIKNLYKRGRITIDGVRESVSGGVITAEEFKQITGQYYTEE